MTVRIGVLNGPNLNLLGTREPEHYGTLTLAEIERRIGQVADEASAEIECFQSNDEGTLVDWVQARAPSIDGWLVNAAALTHTSVALRDAIQASGRPFVEVHLSNVYAREPFRHTSLLADLAIGVIAGFRVDSYVFGLRALIGHLQAAE
ncbi:MAG: type II 3-dehydroquinate dehydratase [Gemmatimonadota bacterium]|nr:type II 3-dehydroquinate dehydratase [Gemmatimonadota bacterium]